MKRVVSRLLGFACLLALTACGGGPEGGGGGSISGTVTAPDGVTITDTVVFACYLGSCDNAQSKRLTASGQSAPYEFSGLEVGQSYAIFAVKDANGNGEIDEGDHIGETEALVVVPARNVDIVMARGSSSISGALIYPGSVNPFSEIAGQGSGLKPLSLPDDFVISPQKSNDLNTNRPVEVVPGEVLVNFKEGVSAQELGSLSVGGVELTAVRTLDLGPADLRLYRAGGLTQATTLALVDELRARPDVVSAFPNWILHALKTPDDEGYPIQWHYDAMNLAAAWDIEDGAGSNVTVAVVDTGAIGHPDLIENLIGGYDFISDPAVAADGDGRDADAFDEGGDSGYHGTHVAGTVAAQTNNGVGVAGVSWGARVVPVRVLGVTGGGTFADILDGTAWAGGQNVSGVPANPNPASVINMSLGGDIGEPCPAEINQFFGSLAADGVITVVAAGNENEDTALKFPASCEGVITVGATGPLNTRAPYSNYGGAVDVMAAGGDVNFSFDVDGTEFPAGVLSTVGVETADGLRGSYEFKQGTSMASPHIAGIVALMLAREPGLSFNEVLTRLQNASTPLSADECERPSGGECGAGLVDAAAALGGQGGGGPKPPAPPPPPPTGELTTYVVAFYCTLGCRDFDFDRSKLIEVEITSNEVPYIIPDLEPGTYQAAAWQDLNGNDEVEDREPFGVYVGPNGNPNLVLAPGESLTNIFIVMRPLVAAGQAEAAPSPAPDMNAALTELLRRLESPTPSSAPPSNLGR